MRVGVVLLLSLTIAAPAAAGTPRVHLRTHGADPAVPSLRHHATAHSASEPFGWCGEERTHDYVDNELANGRYRYHAVYLFPQDGADRFSPALATQMQSDLFGASGLLEHLYGRAVRLDMGTDCGPGFLDISVVKSALSSDDFAAAAKQDDGTMQIVARALAMAGFPTLKNGASRRAAGRLTTNYVVWLDAPTPLGCGIGQSIDDSTRSRSNWNNYGGKVAVIFRADDDFCGQDTVRHEIGHTLGAMQPDAPHAFDGVHCDDAYEDTMCYPDSPVRGSGDFQDQYFDYGNDDYWDPPGGRVLGWWTADENRFICPTASCNVSE